MSKADSDSAKGVGETDNKKVTRINGSLRILNSFGCKLETALFFPSDCFQPRPSNFLPLSECLADTITFQSI